MTLDASAAEPSTVTLPMDLTVEQVRVVHAVLGQALTGGAPVVIDAGAVDRADAAGVQLLLASLRTAETFAHPVTIRNASPALHSAAVTLGVAGHLGLANTSTSGASHA